MNIEQRLKDLKIDLPACPKPVGSYKPVIVANRTAYLSGQIARRSDGVIIAGKVGADLSLEQGQEAARVAVLNILSITQNLIGFEKMDAFLSDPVTPLGSKMLSVSPEGEEGSRYKHNFYDIFTLKKTDHILHALGINGCVRIHREYYFSLCLFYSKIQSRTLSTIFFMKDSYFFTHESSRNFQCFVRASVIHDYYLKIRIIRLQDRFYRLCYSIFFIICRDDYGNLRELFICVERPFFFGIGDKTQDIESCSNKSNIDRQVNYCGY